MNRKLIQVALIACTLVGSAAHAVILELRMTWDIGLYPIPSPAYPGVISADGAELVATFDTEATPLIPPSMNTRRLPFLTFNLRVGTFNYGLGEPDALFEPYVEYFTDIDSAIPEGFWTGLPDRSQLGLLFGELDVDAGGNGPPFTPPGFPGDPTTWQIPLTGWDTNTLTPVTAGVPEPPTWAAVLLLAALVMTRRMPQRR